MNLFELLLIILGVFLIYILVIAVLVLRTAIIRTDSRDWNFDPNKDDAKTFPASGNSPYRTSARESNIWWNSQKLERLELTSFDGLRLVGHLLYAKKKTNRLAFVVHGHRCVSGEMGFISRMYYEMGYNVFCADQRAHGKSEGKYIGMGWLERHDMNDWIELLLQKLGDNTEIVLHGISMGAATVMMMSGGRDLSDKVKCAIEDCGYTTAYDTFLSHLKRDFKPLLFKRLAVATAGVFARILAGYGFKQASAKKLIKDASFPMLFIHGTHDDVVPFEMMRELYDAHAGNKQMLVIECARHGVSYFDKTDEYTAKVKEFIAQYD